MTTLEPKHPPINKLYGDFLTVVYGLVAVKGLEKLGELLSQGKLHTDSILLLAGAYMVGLHLWVVYSTYSEDTVWLYVQLVKHNKDNKQRRVSRTCFALVDVLSALFAAGPIVVSFYSLPDNRKLFFGSYISLTGLGVLYDLYVQFYLMGFLARGASWRNCPKFKRVEGLAVAWFIVDSLSFGLFLVLFLCARTSNPRYPWVLSAAFVTVAFLSLFSESLAGGPDTRA